MNPMRARWLGPAVVAAVLASGLAVASDADPPIPSPELWESVHQTSRPRVEREPPTFAEQLLLSLQDDVDVTDYLLDLDFQPTTTVGQPGTVTGSVTITAQSLVAGLQHLALDLRSNMNVSGATRGFTSLAFTHVGNVLDVTLDHPFGAGEPFTVRVAYGGQPVTSSGSIDWTKKGSASTWGQMVSTLSEPQGARDWWPCKDRPDDKAMVEERWTVPSNWIATGNGLLLGTRGGRAIRWRPTSCRSPRPTTCRSPTATPRSPAARCPSCTTSTRTI